MRDCLALLRFGYENILQYKSLLLSIVKVIDRLLLETLKPFANILYSTISMSEGVSNISSLLNCKMDEKEKFISTFSQKIYKLIKICLSWLEITDSEFILDPDFYVIN